MDNVLNVPDCCVCARVDANWDSNNVYSPEGLKFEVMSLLMFVDFDMELVSGPSINTG